MGRGRRDLAPGGLLTAPLGRGPLLQRDYWAVVDRSRLGPAELAGLVAERFADFAPADLCFFRRVDGAEAPVEEGDELEVHIRGAGSCRVRAVHRNANSLTLATLAGHPEAGRITFGAYRNLRGDVVFHIRSRARSGSRFAYAGFLAIGEAMQTDTWVEFVERVALTAGEGVLGSIHADTVRLREGPADAPTSPTYLAQGA